jgi:[ribosomal protein S18]-alanine N-acetyltransferase
MAADKTLLDDVTLSYRPMNVADIDQVLEIERAISQAPWTQGNFESSLNSDYQCWILEHKNTPAGYAVLSFAADEAELLIIGIDRRYQGQGLGRKLLLHMMSCAEKRKARAVFLEVRASNEVAQGLYASEGFNEVGIRPAYYPAAQGREDAVIMALEFY